MRQALQGAERLKLARILGVPITELEFLSGLAIDDIRGLRERISRSLFDQHRPLFQRLAAASKLLPSRITAGISEKVFGPLLSARVSGLLPPERAIKVAARLPTEFLAELCLSLDPQDAPDLLQRMPIRTVIEVAQVLLRRGEYITMACFVDSLSNQAIRSVVDAVRDDAALVQIAFYVGSPERLDQLIALLPDQRLRGAVQCTTQDDRDLQQAGIALLCRVSDVQKGRLGDAALSLGDPVLKQLLANVERENGTEVLSVVVANMSAAHRARAAALLESRRQRARKAPPQAVGSK